MHCSSRPGVGDAGGRDWGLDTLGEGCKSGWEDPRMQSCLFPRHIPSTALSPSPQTQSSPLGAERLNTITREMGPSCRTDHICRTSAWRARTQSPSPTPVPPPALKLLPFPATVQPHPSPAPPQLSNPPKPRPQAPPSSLPPITLPHPAPALGATLAPPG